MTREYAIGTTIKLKNGVRVKVIEDIESIKSDNKKVKINSFDRALHNKNFSNGNNCSKCVFSRRVLTGFTSYVECAQSSAMYCFGELRTDNKNIIYILA